MTGTPTPPFSDQIAEGFGTSGASSGLYGVLADYIAGPEMAGVLSQQYGVIPPTVVQPGMRLPANGQDGQVVDAIVDSSNGIVWRFRYRESASVPYQWEFVGGPPLRAEVLTNQSLSGTNAWSDLSTVGPSITAPFSGDYDFTFGCQQNTYTNANNVAISGIWNITKNAQSGLTMTVLTDNTAGNTNLTDTQSTRITAISANDVMRLRYQLSGNTGPVSFANRFLTILPVRVQGG
jgi:hypothetical protein